MFRYILVGTIVTAGIIGVQLYRTQTQTASTVEPTRVAKPTIKVIRQKNTDNIAIKQTPEAFANTQIQNDYEPKSVAATDSADPVVDPWQADESLPPTPARYTSKGINAQPVKINKQKISMVGVGDTIRMPLPQTSQDYEMSVQEVGRHTNGDKSLKGHLRDEPDFTVVMTEGRHATFATINTPEGSFLLEATGSQGWVMSQTDLDNLTDPNVVDYQIPEITR